MNSKIILGIETSCDETSAAVVADGTKILSNVISSQINLHRQYGGVVPEVASRKHVELIMPVIDQAITEAGIEAKDIDAVGVTYGPGLVGALLVGLSAAKALAFTLGVPLVGVNHMEAHICANYLQNPELVPPFICLVVSGGHTQIVKVTEPDQYQVLGSTRDDAAGEAFDKVARTIGLGYPGGPLIDKAAALGDADAVHLPKTHFEGSFDFSFSGIKTAVLNYINNKEQKNEKWIVEDIAAGFQKAVVDVLVSNTISAAKRAGINTVTLAGGVAANSLLRSELEKATLENSMALILPRPVLCTDNAAMVACVAYRQLMKGKISGLNLNAVPNLKLGH
ncbi:MAG: tRNA (adenosine(37)-N6)-threonylcarbamoyltransferase complex transferase subunit TsaD [Eubacteriales bacterium]|nr:tRNA (adenosine(37)-N6)-threonylcarbamoyltransferase complex transferase subunit TsaD [Eubacteriales bacterium]